jgi:hypothetical protein
VRFKSRQLNEEKATYMTQSTQKTGGAGKARLEPLTREELYDLVWKEPMLRIGERMGVSSSYVARVCTDLRVPRPPRGYWAQLEFGKVPPERPALSPVRPGDTTTWSPGASLPSLSRVPKVSQSLSHPRSPRGTKVGRGHELLVGAKPHFLKTRKSEEGLLRPFKRLLVDITTSEGQLDAALAATSDLFLALEARGNRVMFAPPEARMRRSEFEVREAPNKNHYYRGQWSPDRITVVYIGDVPIGLTIFETLENVEVMYVNGTYIPVSELSPTQLRRFQGPMYWKHQQHRVSGRFCLQAYCPHWMVDWSKQWRAQSVKDLSRIAPEIVRELESAAPMLATLVKEAEDKAAAQRREWEEESRRRREEEERARQVKLRLDSQSDLVAAIETWHKVKGVRDWLALVEREIQELGDAERAHLTAKLEEAKKLIGDADALEALRKWKAPRERQ